MKYKCTEERFLSDVKDHELTIVRDDGVHRHIRLKRPGSGCYHFDIITWPWHLCISGDCGTYVFQRLEDMFSFFREPFLEINPCYWGEKLESIDRHGGFKEFDEDKFKSVVREHLLSWIREHKKETTKEERRDLWWAVDWDVLGADGDGGGYRKQIAAMDFSHKVNDSVGEFSFQDFWEYDLGAYTFRYLWCLYAIVWGIQQYDKAKEGK